MKVVKQLEKHFDDDVVVKFAVVENSEVLYFDFSVRPIPSL